MELHKPLMTTENHVSVQMKPREENMTVEIMCLQWSDRKMLLSLSFLQC